MKKGLIVLMAFSFFCAGAIYANAETEIALHGDREVLAIVQSSPREVVSGLYSVDVKLLLEKGEVSRTLLTGIPGLKKNERVRIIVLVVRDTTVINIVPVAVRP